MTCKLSFEETPNQDDIQVLIRGITDYAKQQRGFDALDFFAFFIALLIGQFSVSRKFQSTENYTISAWKMKIKCSYLEILNNCVSATATPSTQAK